MFYRLDVIPVTNQQKNNFIFSAFTRTPREKGVTAFCVSSLTPVPNSSSQHKHKQMVCSVMGTY